MGLVKLFTKFVARPSPSGLALAETSPAGEITVIEDTQMLPIVLGSDTLPSKKPRDYTPITPTPDVLQRHGL